MVLVDTSIWIAHLREGRSRLGELLEDAGVACHPFIIGELACGNLKNRAELLSLFHALTLVTILEHEELLYFIEHNKVMGKGLGFVDMHLLASACLAHIPLWSFDKKLHAVAAQLKIAYIE
ncbi:MAG: type II toxin-antitoxin system VapC family toxin [Deltaproteobacteria bacterium]|nr:type II toxin-antitoxin system VapC family toxin [Deltaproteobacteria bacterium]